MKAHNLPDGDKRVTNDPMEATYIGMHMWAQAVAQAGTTNVDAVRQALGYQTFRSPSGFDITLDAKNHHLHKPVVIGEVQANGQFQVVWKTEGPIRAQAWSPFIPGEREEGRRLDLSRGSAATAPSRSSRRLRRSPNAEARLAAVRPRRK